MREIKLSDEQEIFINEAFKGKNILVDACIGSGKTTVIQILCDKLPKNKKILYLTYNKLLKYDAKNKIRNKNVLVQNYDGFAYMALQNEGISANIGELVEKFNEKDPQIDIYDILIVDEYQDIKSEHTNMLERLKEDNENLQIIMVGDMEQKIYDNTTLDVKKFADKYLVNYLQLEFTKCFRINEELAEKLGRIWKKKIIGVNENCNVEIMSVDEVVDFLEEQDPKDILCLGSRYGAMTRVLNELEENYPEKYNKNSVYASIANKDLFSKSYFYPSSTAIFTTFDSSKGLEKKICIVFDYTEKYWKTRIEKPNQSYEILRNIFCVAASRGKDKIIFVDYEKEEMLSEDTISEDPLEIYGIDKMNISEMFDFKYKEDIQKCYSLLNIQKIESTDNTTIRNIKTEEGYIDLSPCIGIYQEAMYFTGYDIDKSIEFFVKMKDIQNLFTEEIKNLPLERKILFLVSKETFQDRYFRQVEIPFVSEEAKQAIENRLAIRLDKDDKSQVGCSMYFGPTDGVKGFHVFGIADIVKDDIVYELKFVSELAKEHYLQCACYMVALGNKKGILWNTRTNDSYSITIPNKKEFLDKVAVAITKGKMKQYKEFECDKVWEDEQLNRFLGREK